ncbi:MULTISPECIES: M56 family metallopeptidase [Streptomyces]|uniref:Zn-dependent protease with chaperone function/type IV secretory pathway VirB2 component (Pilin) n=1 Tax=Streptomyces murinus TaxID=33900 RepID=A0A7W3NIZ1_STRMR|nr:MULTISPECIES: M56 family metallopeptidase [Streptomyces]MBA9051401.1 Zn-dependent protease with chaperone function/type IV secretory pathway VirB2 component (pilin) [Streptomyces murinus]UWW92782.1 M48 family metalloprotease [Streptomyces murinus]WSI83400.1 M56 family metallopeptidase [Streptomyces murinus]WUD05127.1 M56 family metallopeptidase [Streptomyces murinus]
MSQLLCRAGEFLLRFHHVLPPLILAVAAGVILPRYLVRSSWAHRAPRLTLGLWGLLVLVLTASLSLAVLQFFFPVAESPRFPEAAGGCFLTSGGRCVAVMLDGLERPSARAWAGFAAAVCPPLALALAFGRQVFDFRRRRARHAELLGMVGSWRSELRATVLPHTTPAVYCLPGRAPQVVVSEGAVHALTGEQLTAALEHERAHIAGRHHLLAAAASAFGALSRRLPLARFVRDEVPLLLEMAADDRALRRCSRRALAVALYAVAAGQAPHAALAAGGSSALLRMRRILQPPTERPTVLGVALLVLALAVGLPGLAAVCCSVPGPGI